MWKPIGYVFLQNVAHWPVGANIPHRQKTEAIVAGFQRSENLLFRPRQGQRALHRIVRAAPDRFALLKAIPRGNPIGPGLARVFDICIANGERRGPSQGQQIGDTTKNRATATAESDFIS